MVNFCCIFPYYTVTSFVFHCCTAVGAQHGYCVIATCIECHELVGGDSGNFTVLSSGQVMTVKNDVDNGWMCGLCLGECF